MGRTNAMGLTCIALKTLVGNAAKYIVRASLCCFVVGDVTQVQADDNLLDIRIIIDVSGSMKKNDPENLRIPAVELIIQQLPDGAKSGIWTFAQYVNMLVPYDKVDSRWKEVALSKIKEINSVGLFTDITSSVDNASFDRNSSSNPGNRHLILLTDGVIDVSRDPALNAAARAHLLDVMLPELKAGDVQLHAISLSRNTDNELMQKMALATGGMAATAENADELAAIFLRIFDNTTPRDQVQLEGNKFLIDSSIEELTALVFKTPGSSSTVLKSPDGEEFDADNGDADINWYASGRFDLITVLRPYEGEWEILAELEPNNRVTIVSNLSLQVNPLPNNVFIGQTPQLLISLLEDGHVITQSDLLELLDMRLQVSLDDRVIETRALDRTQSSSSYSATLDMFTQPGVYELDVTLDGKTFNRRFKQWLAVHEPVLAHLETIGSGASSQYIVKVLPNMTELDMEKSSVMASLVQPGGGTKMVPAELVEGKYWRIKLEKLGPFGRYKVGMQVTTISTDGSTSKFSLSPISFNHPASTLTTTNSNADFSPNSPQRSYEVGDIDEFGSNLPLEDPDSSSLFPVADAADLQINASRQSESTGTRGSDNSELVGTIEQAPQGRDEEVIDTVGLNSFPHEVALEEAAPGNTAGATVPTDPVDTEQTQEVENLQDSSLQTGVADLDESAGGGFFAENLYLIIGVALANIFLFGGAFWAYKRFLCGEDSIEIESEGGGVTAKTATVSGSDDKTVADSSSDLGELE